MLSGGLFSLRAQDAAAPVAGSHVMIVAETPLLVGGKEIRKAASGERFEVAATNAGQSQVFVSVVGADGKKAIAALPLANVVVVDAPGQASQPPQSAPPAAAATPAPAAVPQPDAQGAYNAVDVARYFKADRAAATALFAKKPLKIRGSVEKAEVQVGSDAPHLTFKTDTGLPKIKTKVHPSISRDREFYKSALMYNWYYDGWYSTGHKLEFRPAGAGLEARFKYKRTYSSGSGNSTYKSWSDWFAIMTPGDVLIANGTCEGLMMDVVIDAAELSRPKP